MNARYFSAKCRLFINLVLIGLVTLVLQMQSPSNVKAAGSPAAPTLSSPANGATIADSSPAFDWSDVTGAVQYQIQVDNNSDFSSPEIDTTVTSSTYTPTSFLNNGTYSWHVRTSDVSATWSSWSTAWTVTIADDSRVDLDINSGWKFHLNDVSGAQAVNFNDTSWLPVSLPHTWNNMDGQDGGDNDYHRGIGWYRKHYTIPSTYAGKRIFIRFEAVSKAADVYVNGTLVGHHDGAFAAFVFDITSAATIGGDNVIAVKADNSDSLDIAPISGDFNQDGGIFRPAHLLVTDKVHVTPLDFGSPGVYLTPTNVSASSANLQAVVKVDNNSSTQETVSIQTTIKDASGTTVATMTSSQNMAGSSSATFTQNTSVTNPHLWNGRSDPYLYQAVVQVMLGNTVVDQVTQPLGFRFFHVDPSTGFSLNGHSYDLHGVAMHEGRLNEGRAISDADRTQDISLIMELGATFIRLAHYQHSETIYDLADADGLVLSTEVPLVNSISSSTAFSDNIQQQLKELIRQNYNHPSVFFWGLYNELTQTSDDYALVGVLNTVAHSEDTTRPTTGADLGNTTMSIPTDLLGWNIYHGWYSGSVTDLTWMVNTAHSTYPNLAVSEYGAGASINEHEDNPAPPDPNSTWHPEEYQNLFHESYWKQMLATPFLWAKTVWVAFDFAVDSRDEGDTPGRNDKGLITIDRSVKKDSFYWYKANWSTDPVVYITSRLFTPRDNNVIPVKVYSNCDKVELLVNGTSKGILTSTDHIYQWSNIFLGLTSNTVKAICTRGTQQFTDSVVWDTPALTPLTVGVQQETDSRIVYTGTWTSFSGTGPNGGSTSTTSQQNAVAKFDFKGTGLRLYRTLASDRGSMQVCVDGVCQTVSDNNSTTLWNQMVSITTGLTNAVHRAVIRNLSTSTIDLDAVEVLGPPDAPSLTSPADAATITDSTPAFDWGDVATATQYHIQVAANSSFTNPVVDADTTTSSYAPGTGLANATYFWHVRASNGVVGPYSTSRTVILAAPPNQPPTAPGISAPGNGMASISSSPTLTWSASTDPDAGDPLTYTVLLGTAPNPSGTACTTTTTSCPAGSLAAGQTYYWSVRVNDGNGHTVSSAEAHFTTNAPPTAPGISAPSSGATGIGPTPTLSWSASTDPDAGDALTYSVFFGTSTGPTTTLCTTPSTSCPAGPLAAGQIYYWSVQVNDGSGHTVRSSEAHFTTNAPPTAPGISAPSNGASGVSLTPTLSWSASTDPDAGDTLTYSVFFGTATGPTNTLCTTTTTSCPAGSLDSSQTYYWSVRVDDGQGHTASSSEAHFTTNRPPTAPGISAPSDGATGVSSRPTLSWSASTDPDSGDTLTYTVFLGTSTGPSETACTTTTTSCPAGSLAAGQTYYWSVQVNDGSGHTADSAEAHFTTNAPPTAPGISAPSSGATGIGPTPTLSWSASTDPDSGDTLTYTVFFGTSTGPTSTQCTTTTTSCPAGSLTAGQTYYWSVQVNDGHGHTVSSSEAHFTTNAPPTAPGISAPSDSATGIRLTPTLSWSASTDPDASDTLTYSVFFGTSTGPTNTLCTTTSTSCPAGSLASSQTYYWSVRADDGHGHTASSTEAHFMTNQPPTAPGISAPGDGAAGVSLTPTLSWSASTDPDSGDTLTYTVFLGTSAGPTNTLCTTTSTSCLASSLTNKMTYYWFVRVDDGHGHTADSAEAHFLTVPKLGTLAAPTLSAPKNGLIVYTPQTTLTWRPVVHAKGYFLQIMDAQHMLVQSASTTTTSFLTKTLGYGVYSWILQTKDPLMNLSKPSKTWSFEVTLNKTPKKNTALTNGLVKFTWLAVKGKKYELQVSTQPNFQSGVVIDTVPRLNKPTYTIPKGSPLPHGTYYWRVSVDGGVTWTPGWSIKVK